MDDVVGIVAKDRRGRLVAFMTWGRLFDAVDSRLLVREVKKHSKRYEGAPMRDFRLCSALTEVSGFEYFFEGLIRFSREPIPFGKGYKAWQDKKRGALISHGADLYFLGRRHRNPTNRPEDQQGTSPRLLPR
jgi:hypothetical protein